MTVQEEVFKVPQPVPSITKIASENIQLEKQASSEGNQTLLTANFKSVEQTQSQEMVFSETASTPSKKKRSLKAQTKKQSKKSDSK
jgi:poly(A) polymerase Pap1